MPDGEFSVSANVNSKIYLSPCYHSRGFRPILSRFIPLSTSTFSNADMLLGLVTELQEDEQDSWGYAC